LQKIEAIDDSFYTSHDALHLYYEEAMVSENYDLSAHSLWLGNLNRSSPAHIEFIRGIANPIGVKIGAGITEGEVENIAKILNPQNEPAKLTLIIRMGNEINKYLPKVINAVLKNKLNVIWMCDPMHANTRFVGKGKKNRLMGDIFQEIESFGAILAEHDLWIGGLHLEMTGDDVLECSDDELNDFSKSKTMCDPRLNSQQAQIVADLVARKWKFSL
jgi:3-deoxy-7-phosphoheptulonate synthase